MQPTCFLAAGLYAASAFTACCVHAASSGFAPGSGTLDARPLPVQVPSGALSPLSSTMPPLLLRKGTAEPVYYLAAGLGVPRYGIADLPGAGAWRVEPDADCARLVPVALDEVKQPAVQPVTAQQNALPLQCAAAFEGSCTSRDQRLRVGTAFQGSRRTARTGGGFFGTEGQITASFYTGIRTLTIEHLPSGRQWRMDEALQDSAGYSAPQTAIRYLPELQRVLLLGVSNGPEGAQGRCITLPSG
ncbi:MAG: hypothetical protein V4679_03940 [Pseudomonadota bacterium]